MMRMRWGTGLWAGLMLAWLPAAAQEGPPHPMGPPPDMAQGGPGTGGPGMGHDGGPLAELARAEADHVGSQAIADLAHAPLADVQRVVRAFGVPAALRYYDVAPKAFHDATQPRLVALVRGAAHDQLISGSEADRMVERLQRDRPPPPP